jgi:hypothetical protein
VRFEKGDELVVGNASCLGETKHVTSNFDVDMASGSTQIGTRMYSYLDIGVPR